MRKQYLEPSHYLLANNITDVIKVSLLLAVTMPIRRGSEAHVSCICLSSAINTLLGSIIFW